MGALHLCNNNSKIYVVSNENIVSTLFIKTNKQQQHQQQKLLMGLKFLFFRGPSDKHDTTVSRINSKFNMNTTTMTAINNRKLEYSC
jgi:hypothetical protein